MTLDEAMKAICAEHDLTSVSVHYHTSEALQFFSANAHWNRTCASGNGKTAAEAIGVALQEAAIKRGGALPIPAIETEALA